MSISPKSRFIACATALMLAAQVNAISPDTAHEYRVSGRDCLAPFAMANTELDILADRLNSIVGIQPSTKTPAVRKSNASPIAKRMAQRKTTKAEKDFSLCAQTAESFINFFDIHPNVKQGKDILYSYEKKLQAVLADVSLGLALDKRAGRISQEEYEQKMAQIKDDITPFLQKLDEFILSGAKTATRLASGKIVIAALEEQYRRHEKTLLYAIFNLEKLKLIGESRKRPTETKEHHKNAIQGMNMVRLYNLLILNANERMRKLDPAFIDERTEVMTRFRELMAQIAEQKTADSVMLKELGSLSTKLKPWRVFSEKEQRDWSSSRILFLDACENLLDLINQETPDTAKINKFISQLLILNPSAETANTESSLIQAA